jgi:AbrB family looped-hinge helix DNA binding protein
VTAKYQITIPLAVRKELGIAPGSEVGIEKQGGEFMDGVKKDDDMDDVRDPVN